MNERIDDSSPAPCYVASYRSSEQIAEDSWRTFTRTKVCDDQTTMKDVMEWSCGENVEISKAT